MTQLTIKKVNSYLNEHNPKVLVKSGLNKYTTDLASVVFRNGVLIVPRTKTVLQKLLSLYHPHNALFLHRQSLFLET